jgi:hypothetical protein
LGTFESVTQASRASVSATCHLRNRPELSTESTIARLDAPVAGGSQPCSRVVGDGCGGWHWHGRHMAGSQRLGGGGDSDVTNPHCEPVPAKPDDYLFNYLRTALRARSWFRHPRRTRARDVKPSRAVKSTVLAIRVWVAAALFSMENYDLYSVRPRVGDGGLMVASLQAVRGHGPRRVMTTALPLPRRALLDSTR